MCRKDCRCRESYCKFNETFLNNRKEFREEIEKEKITE
jgi:hypothetical protein